jgi:DNA anti-recombination protein RmuC
MNRAYEITLFAITCSVIIIFASCEPTETAVNERQERLYSAENAELKKELSDTQIKYANELAEKQRQLEQCQTEKTQLAEQKSEETVKAFEESAVSMLMEQIGQLTQENAELKAQIEELTGSEPDTITPDSNDSSTVE